MAPRWLWLLMILFLIGYYLRPTTTQSSVSASDSPLAPINPPEPVVLSESDPPSEAVDPQLQEFAQHMKRLEEKYDREIKQELEDELFKAVDEMLMEVKAELNPLPQNQYASASGASFQTL